MEFFAGAAKRYTIHRTSEQVTIEGADRTSVCQFDKARVVVSVSLDAEAAWSALIYEATEAWREQFPPSSDPSEMLKWIGSVKDELYTQLAAVGGMDALMALPVEKGLLDGIQCSQPDDGVRRLSKFAFLTPENFLIAQHLCKKEGIDPFSTSFHAVQVAGAEGSLEVRLCLHLDAIRAKAHMTGKYAGIDAPKFYTMYDSSYEGGGYPDKGSITVYRLTEDGERKAFTAEATWKECFGLDESKWPALVREKPRTCMEARLEAKALRKAFDLPFYLREELPAKNRVEVKPFGRPIVMPTEDSQVRDEMSDDDLPQSSDGLHRMLVERYGLSPGQRQNLIREVSASFGDRADGDEQKFYAAVLRAAANR